ncbi:MAG: DNA replication and repair protein RecF [Proteobacteria bacterium]|nr:DNA replication and repair protein RecF [Pseudomonadota bacterium]
MFIKKLKIHNFRNTLNQEYIFSNKVNIFYGDNGVGKTTILEAINFVSSGKSFRRGSFKNLINQHSNDLTVYLECILNEHSKTLSVNKNINGKWTGKINNCRIGKLVEITNIFPVVSIDPEVYSLIDSGPLHRRNFLDWLVFHVKHDYIILWKKVYKCIKQLNILYKHKAPINEIKLWEKSFIAYSCELNTIRKNTFNEIKSNIVEFSVYMQKEVDKLSIDFKQGWNDDISLEEQMEIDRSKNLLYGKLLHGPHKMDIKIKTHRLQAAQTLSRGQKKILSIAFYMAYIQFLNKNNVHPVLCLDDFDAELDSEKLQKAADFFKNSKAQIFITSVQKEKITKAFKNADLFHVKHLL